jgi:HEAT repeat protein
MDRVRGARYARSFGTVFETRLQELLNDSFYECRAHAALSLGHIGSLSSIPQMINLLSDDVEEVRFSTAEGLGLLANDKVIFPLISSLADHSRETKRQIMISLSKQDSGTVHHEMNTWLSSITEGDYAMETPEAIIRIDVARGLMETIIYTETFEDILAFGISSPDLEMQRMAALTIGELRLHNFLPQLLERHDEADDDLRLAVITALCNLEFDSKFEILSNHMSDTYDFIRENLAGTLVGEFPRSQVKHIVEQYITDAYAPVRAKLASVLSDPEYIAELRELLDDRVDYVRQAVMEALVGIGTPECLEILENHTEEDDLVHISWKNAVQSLRTQTNALGQ